MRASILSFELGLCELVIEGPAAAVECTRTVSNLPRASAVSHVKAAIISVPPRIVDRVAARAIVMKRKTPATDPVRNYSLHLREPLLKSPSRPKFDCHLGLYAREERALTGHKRTSSHKNNSARAIAGGVP